MKQICIRVLVCIYLLHSHLTYGALAPHHKAISVGYSPLVVPLVQACQSGLFNTAFYHIVFRGILPIGTDERGLSPAHAAIKANSPAILNLLFYYGANPNEEGLLLRATASGNPDNIALITAHRLFKTPTDPESRNCLAKRAAKTSHPFCTQRLLWTNCINGKDITDEIIMLACNYSTHFLLKRAQTRYKEREERKKQQIKRIADAREALFAHHDALTKEKVAAAQPDLPLNRKRKPEDPEDTDDETKKQKQDVEVACLICFEPLSLEQLTTMIASSDHPLVQQYKPFVCMHLYCKACAEKWRDTKGQASHNSCPYCRAGLEILYT